MTSDAKLKAHTNERERLAARVAEGLHLAFVKLTALKDDIQRLRQEFRELANGDTIRGCTTWTQFCNDVIHRDVRTVRYLLAGGKPNNKKKPRPALPPAECEPEIISGQPEPVPDLDIPLESPTLDDCVAQGELTASALEPEAEIISGQPEVKAATPEPTLAPIRVWQEPPEAKARDAEESLKIALDFAAELWAQLTAIETLISEGASLKVVERMTEAAFHAKYPRSIVLLSNEQLDAVSARRNDIRKIIEAHAEEREKQERKSRREQRAIENVTHADDVTAPNGMTCCGLRWMGKGAVKNLSVASNPDLITCKKCLVKYTVTPLEVIQ